MKQSTFSPKTSELDLQRSAFQPKTVELELQRSAFPPQTSELKLQRSAFKMSRRRFLAVATAVTVAAPAVLTASKTDKQVVLGEGDYRYEVIHNWPQLPDKYSWQTTHNVAVDKQGFFGAAEPAKTQCNPPFRPAHF